MINKSLVKKNFSRAANSYDKHAKVQKYMSKKLSDYIEQEDAESILEIGPGTGIFTQHLLKKFQKSNFLLAEISPGMIKRCQEKFKKYDNIRYLVEDGEKLNLEEKFDLIASNASFQWFQDLKQALINFRDTLKEDGQVYFSTFGAKNFCELRSSFEAISQGYDYSQKFYGKDELKELLSEEFREVYIEEEEYIEKFDRVIDFLKAIKKIGANSAKKDKPMLTPTLLRKLESEYQNKFTVEGKVIVTHHLIYVKLKK